MLVLVGQRAQVTPIVEDRVHKRVANGPRPFGLTVRRPPIKGLGIAVVAQRLPFEAGVEQLHRNGHYILAKHDERYYLLNQGDRPCRSNPPFPPFFHDEAAAYDKLESILWPNGPVCPKCKGMERITKVKGGRLGLWRCGPCKRQFRVTVGTVFESAHVPLNLWFQAMHLLCSSKKGFSSHQLHRVLGVTYKTAWFMTHRIREAMAPFADVSARIDRLDSR